MLGKSPAKTKSFVTKYSLTIILLGGMVMLSSFLRGTTPFPKNTIKPTYTKVDEMPRFNGDLAKYLGDNIKYPVTAKDRNISGTVFVKFVITKNGDVTNAEILKGVDKQLDSTALSVVNTMPRWIPAQQNGGAVDFTYTIPIKFMLQ